MSITTHVFVADQYNSQEENQLTAKVFGRFPLIRPASEVYGALSALTEAFEEHLLPGHRNTYLICGNSLQTRNLGDEDKDSVIAISYEVPRNYEDLLKILGVPQWKKIAEQSQLVIELDSLPDSKIFPR